LKPSVEKSMPIVGLRLPISLAASSGPAMPRSRAQLRFTFNASSRSADLKNEWLRFPMSSRLQVWKPPYNCGSPMLVPGQLRPWSPFAMNESEALEPLP